MHGRASVGLPVDAGRDLRPGCHRGLDGDAVRVVVARATASIGGGYGRRRHDVDGGGRGRRRWQARVVVDGRRGSNGGRGIVVAQLLPQAVLHVLVAQRGRVADLVFQNA